MLLPDHLGALAGPKFTVARQRRVDRDVVLRSLDQRLERSGCRAPPSRASVASSTIAFSDSSSNSRVDAEPVFWPKPHGDGQLLIELDQVDGDGGVGPARAGTLAAVEVDFDGVGLGHVDHLVGDRLDFFA